MERLALGDFSRLSLADEHYHRYQISARLAKGRVVDCACGVGYGSEILMAPGGVTSYLGVDPSSKAIATAERRFGANPRVKYAIGSLENVPCASDSVDTFVMLETLEHVEDPAFALSCIRQKLAKEGLLIGSVPSKEYEELCERAYGPNPYHLHRFDEARLVELLAGQFEAYSVFSTEYILGTLFKHIGPGRADADVQTACAGEMIFDADSDRRVNGSYFFLAGGHSAVESAVERLGCSAKYFASIPKARLDLEEVKPLYAALDHSETMVRERDEAIKRQSSMLDERWDLMKKLEALIAEKDKAIANQANFLDERWVLVQNLEASVTVRDIANAAQARLLEERWGLLKKLEALIAEKDQAIASQENLLDERWALMQKLEGWVTERDEAISSQALLLEERWKLLEWQEARLKTQDDAIAHQARMLEDRWAILEDMERKIVARDEAISAQAVMNEERMAVIRGLETAAAERDAAISRLESTRAKLEGAWALRLMKKLRLVSKD